MRARRMLGRAVGRVLGLSLVIVFCSAHVGSPDVWYEGTAGPYHVLVSVRLPGVVPGVAQIAVHVDGAPPDRVAVGVNYFNAVAPPPPDDATRDPADSASFAGHLWIMHPGSNAVSVTISGRRGTATTIVPVVAVATRRLPLYRWLGVVLAIIGLVLFAGAVSIVGSAVRESTLAPGELPDARRRRRARLAMAATAVVMTGILYGGKSWWDNEDQSFQQALYHPMTVRATLHGDTLAMTITDSAWLHRADTAWLHARRLAPSVTPLIPDHGKLVHLFLVGDAGAFAHLHPTTVDSVTFSTTLPPLPAGHYAVFADIVQESGFDQTLVADIAMPAQATRWVASDSDDAWSLATPISINGVKVVLADGSVLRHIGTATPVAGGDAGLRFVVEDPSGAPAVLQPYMGMAGHAVVMSRDRRVFIHLHPMGTVSSASQQTFVVRTSADTATGAVARRLSAMTQGGMAMPATLGDTVSFPYAFPTAGSYVVWVEFKRNGRIVTVPLTITVGDSAASRAGIAAATGCPGRACAPRATANTDRAATRAPGTPDPLRLRG